MRRNEQQFSQNKPRVEFSVQAAVSHPSDYRCRALTWWQALSQPFEALNGVAASQVECQGFHQAISAYYCVSIR